MPSAATATDGTAKAATARIAAIERSRDRSSGCLLTILRILPPLYCDYLLILKRCFPDHAIALPAASFATTSQRSGFPGTIRAWSARGKAMLAARASALHSSD